MEKNVGKKDRKLRIGLGAILVGLGGLGQAGFLPVGNTPPIPVILSVLGLVLVVTGYLNKCLLYRLAGIDTSE